MPAHLTHRRQPWSNRAAKTLLEAIPQRPESTQVPSKLDRASLELELQAEGTRQVDWEDRVPAAVRQPAGSEEPPQVAPPEPGTWAVAAGLKGIVPRASPDL